jgi:hypothetical protein
MLTDINPKKLSSFTDTLTRILDTKQTTAGGPLPLDRL